MLLRGEKVKRHVAKREVATQNWRMLGGEMSCWGEFLGRLIILHSPLSSDNEPKCHFSLITLLNVEGSTYHIYKS